MPATMNTIEVPLAEGALATPEHAEVLKGLFRALAALPFDEGRQWPQMRRALERNGWAVECSLQWHVEVRRGREYEEACAPTLDEAFASVCRVASPEESLEGTP